MAEEHGEVLLTGAAGFIGSHVVEELLRAGKRVRALVRYNAQGWLGHLEEVKSGLGEEQAARLSIHFGDVGDPRCLREFSGGVEAVYHLAALIGIPYSYQAPDSYVAVNIRGTLNVLEACRDQKVSRLVHTSTSEVYGSALTTPMDERHPLQAQSPYAASKIAADKLVESYVCSYGLPTVTIRPFNTFGPRQSLRAVIPTIIAQALSDQCETVRLGSLDPVRDFTFVADTARAFRLAGEAPLEKVSGYVINLGTGKGISIASLAERILEILEVDKKVESRDERRRPKGSEVQRLISENRLARELIGWKPEVEFEEGIRRTAEWLRPRLDQVRVEEYVK